MKKLLTLITFALWLVVSAGGQSQAQVFPAPEGKIQSSYDKFTDKTTVALLQLQVAEKQYDGDYQRLYLTVLAQFDSPQPKRSPESVTLLFSSWSLWNNRYTEAARLDSIIDGERKAFGSVTPLSREVINGKYVVHLALKVASDDFLRVVNGKKVEMRLDNVEFTLNDPAFKMLRDFAGRISP